MTRGQLIANLDELIQRETDGGLDYIDIIEALQNEISAIKRYPVSRKAPRP